MHVAAGEVIFRQGDAGEGLYLVVSGRLRVSVAADGTEASERMLYDLGRGAIVGEMALLTDRPRAATVHAVRDSDLLLLRVSSFRSLLERSPALVDRDDAAAGRPAARRGPAADRGPAAGTVAGRPHHRRGLRRRSDARAACAGRRATGGAAGPRRLRLAGGRRRGRRGSWARMRRSGRRATRAGPSSSGGCIGVERAHDHVIYQPDAEDTAWSRLCLSQSDVVLLVASAADDPALGAVEARALATGSLRCELALLHAAAQPSGTARWLERPAGGRPPPPARRAGQATWRGWRG